MFGEIKSLTRQTRRRGPFSCVAVIVGILWPLFMFVTVYWLMSFSLRHFRETLALTLGPALSFFLCLLHFGNTYVRFMKGEPTRGLWALVVTLWSAFILGIILGDINYHSYASIYYQYQDLLSYPNLDPDMDRGQTYMDSGIVYFKESTYVASTKAVAFQSTAIYCAAPIIRNPLENQEGSVAVETEGPIVPPTSGTVDWWAVGINCCDPAGNGFTCGEVGNPMARAGIRMLREDARPFFLMAVQEWDSQYKLPSKHPLFFYWVQDPLTQIDGYLINAKNSFFTATTYFFVFTTFITFFVMYILDLFSIP